MKNILSRLLQILTFTGFCAWILLPSPIAKAEETPQQAIETFLATIKSMQFPVKDAVQHKKLAEEANAYLDLDAMGKRALAKHWEQASPEQQKKFLDLLWSLIEFVAYPKSHSFMGEYQITYPEIKPADTGFEVHSVIKQQTSALDAKVVYHVYQKESHWKIDDVVLDDVSITEDLKYQFDKLIAQSQFPGLLNKMQEKLEQAKKENAGAAV